MAIALYIYKQWKMVSIENYLGDCQRIHEANDIFIEILERRFLRLLGLVGESIAPKIEGYGAIAIFGNGYHLVPPCVPNLRKSMQEQHHFWTFTQSNIRFSLSNQYIYMFQHKIILLCIGNSVVEDTYQFQFQLHGALILLLQHAYAQLFPYLSMSVSLSRRAWLTIRRRERDKPRFERKMLFVQTEVGIHYSNI